MITCEVYLRVVKKKPKSFRPNEVSRVMEYEMVNTELNFQKIQDVYLLRQGGYPDCKLTLKDGLVAFVDIKVTTRINEGSARDFFYSTKVSTLKKINSDGFHLLLGYMIRELEPEKFSTLG